jgi:hypothetical protein
MREFKAGDVVRVKPVFTTAFLKAGAIYTVEKADDCGVWLVDLRTTSGDLLTDWPYLPCRFELVNEAEVEAPLEGDGFRTVQGAEREGAHRCVL